MEKHPDKDYIKYGFGNDGNMASGLTMNYTIRDDAEQIIEILLKASNMER